MWHFNRNHQMTFKHDPVVQSCQSWLGVKKPCLEVILFRKVTKCKWSLWAELTVICFCFGKRKRIHLCQWLRCVAWNWIHTSECLWNLDPEMQLSFLEQTKPAVLPKPFRLQQCSDLCLCLVPLAPPPAFLLNKAVWDWSLGLQGLLISLDSS